MITITTELVFATADSLPEEVIAVTRVHVPQAVAFVTAKTM
jgi:hypothetical protein